jgi:hypothetical protein
VAAEQDSRPPLIVCSPAGHTLPGEQGLEFYLSENINWGGGGRGFTECMWFLQIDQLLSSKSENLIIHIVYHMSPVILEGHLVPV